MRRALALLAFAGFAAPAGAQERELHIPEGWVLEKKAEGDLNRDGRDDVAAVLRMRDPANIAANPFLGEERFDTNPRILLVAFMGADSQHKRVLADHALIPRRDIPAMEDHFDSIAIDRGTLRIGMHIFMSAGGWTTSSSSFTFRWSDSAFMLIGYDRDQVARNTGIGEKISINYLTRRRKVIDWNIEDDRQTVGWKMEAIRPLRSLGDVGNGLDFDPDQQ